jgi:hypothetical protein
MEYPRPVQVQHEGRWLRGTLRAARRAGHGPWRGLVTYTDPTVTLSWYHWRPAHELRAATGSAYSVLEDGDVQQGVGKLPGLLRPKGEPLIAARRAEEYHRR